MVRSVLVVVPLLCLALTGCGRKKKPPPAPDTSTVPPAPPKVKAPAGVPQEFVDLVAAKWPGIQEEGDAFLARFAEAKAARQADDREKLQKAIEAANAHYGKVKDEWAKIAYWADSNDRDEQTMERCERYIKTYSGRVKGWDKKAKGLKELSTVSR